MKKYATLANLLFIMLVTAALIPGRRPAQPVPFLTVIGLIEVIYVFRVARGQNARAAGDVTALLYAFLLVWEVSVTKLGLGHKILVPLPEDVMNVFVEQRERMVRGLLSSLALLSTGVFVGLALAIPFGLFAGMTPRLRDMLLPVARVISPVPPIIYAPYLVALMPSFRSASAMILILGIFFPMFMNMILRVGAVDPMILKAAKMLGIQGFQMVTKILIPYLVPGIFQQVKVLLSTSFMALTIAEMMGATSGLGFFIKNYADYGNYTCVVAGILFVAVVVTALNALVAFAEKQIVRWQ